MKTLPSKLFPGCSFSTDDDAGFYDIIPEGFTHPVSLYLGSGTVKSSSAVEKVAAFFDRVQEWDRFCREIFLAVESGSEDDKIIREYFDFYREEVPEVFDVEDAGALALPDMVRCLKLTNMGVHGSGDEQRFHVDFTLGYDQLLCIYFGSESQFDHIAWES